MASRSDSQVYIISGFAAIGGFLYGYDIGVISGVLTMPDFLSTFGDATSIAQGTLTSTLRGAIVGVFLFGCFLGALIAGQAGDRLSRKYSIVLFSIIFIVGAALQSGSVHLVMLLIARLIAGKSRTGR
jgi:SP family sugar:H+ symporter-like MFS transporter